jgi:hypothetical protein
MILSASLTDCKAGGRTQRKNWKSPEKNPKRNRIPTRMMKGTTARVERRRVTRGSQRKQIVMKARTKVTIAERKRILFYIYLLRNDMTSQAIPRGHHPSTRRGEVLDTEPKLGAPDFRTYGYFTSFACLSRNTMKKSFQLKPPIQTPCVG